MKKIVLILLLLLALLFVFSYVVHSYEGHTCVGTIPGSLACFDSDGIKSVCGEGAGLGVVAVGERNTRVRGDGPAPTVRAV